jgi:ubiquinone/menaquinone biosynthesis C-methylase UbiE
MMIPFALPPTAENAEVPCWDGHQFRVGRQTTPVLEYSENFAGWSDELSALHEDTLGEGHPIDFASRRDALRQVEKFVPRQDAVIMDIGCSSGHLIRDMVKAFPQAVIVGADVVKEPLHKLSQKLPGIPLIRFDLLRCPLPDNSVDVLVMLNVFEHIDDDVLAMRKAFCLLKPGGALIMEVPAGPGLYDAYDKELRHFRRYSGRDLYSKLKSAGFIVKRKSHLGFLIFPAFAVVKLMGKYFPKKEDSAVRRQAGGTAANPLIKSALDFETKFLSGISLPFGIRILTVAVKKGT